MSKYKQLNNRGAKSGTSSSRQAAQICYGSCDGRRVHNTQLCRISVFLVVYCLTDLASIIPSRGHFEVQCIVALMRCITLHLNAMYGGSSMIL